MKCIICSKKINIGEQIFWGNQMTCCGPEESDLSYSEATKGLVGAIHLSCLKSPTAAITTSDINAEDEFVVQRSDALSILG